MNTIQPNRLLGLLAASMTVLSSSAQDCSFSDSFNDNVIQAHWSGFSSNDGYLRCREQNGRLEFTAPVDNPGFTLLSGVIGNGWELDLSEDWAVSIRIHVDPSSPQLGDIGLGFFALQEFDSSQVFPRDGYTFLSGLGQSPVTGGLLPYETTRFWEDGDYDDQSFGMRSYVETDIYIWYDSSTDSISHGREFMSGGWQTAYGLRELSTKTTVSIGLFGYSYVFAPASSGNDLWIDDFCLLYGKMVGPTVGACCVDDGCIQTQAAFCSGVWQGVGTTCEDAFVSCSVCEGDLTSDGQVNGADITVLLSEWGSASEGSDLNGDGVVGGADLTILLSSWGACDA